MALGQPNWHTNPLTRLNPLDRSLISYMLHPIRLASDGKLVRGLGMKPEDRPYIMSAHHQAVDKLKAFHARHVPSTDGRRP
jgi:hypothetical protein